MHARLIISVLISAAAMNVARSVRAADWLEETFEAYSVGPLNGQGGWTGNTQRICVVSTTSLTGKAACCDADENPMLPVVYQLRRPVTVPDSGRHVFSFAVRVDTSFGSPGKQATLSLSNGATDAIEFESGPATAFMRIRNEFVFTMCTASWELGTTLTLGTFHQFEIDLDFGEAGDVMDDYVRDVRLDGRSQAGLFTSRLPGPNLLRTPINSLALVNGDALDQFVPDAVYFDKVIGRPASLSVRRWQLY